MTEKLNDLVRNWESFAATDPLWAVLVRPDKVNGGWKQREFFRTGMKFVRRLEKISKGINVPWPTGRALDFGCGVGRLTHALASRFDACVGVDISPTMIDHARRLCRRNDRCSFLVNKAADLSIFPDEEFDFVLSYIVLQHMPEQLSIPYISEMTRVLRPGGLLVFQVPSRYLAHAADSKSGEETREPLSSREMRARLEICEPIPNTVPAGAAFVVQAIVENVSDETWLRNPQFPLNVGNHWRDDSGGLIQEDDGRGTVPLPLKPGDSVQVQITCAAPVQPGCYRLEIDVVQELCGWFSQHETELAQVSLDVVDSAAVDPDSRSSITPRMEMHGLPVNRVCAVLESGGLAVRAILPDASAGAEWRSHFYLAAKE